MPGRSIFLLSQAIGINDFISHQARDCLIRRGLFYTLAPACQASGKKIIDRERNSVQ